MKMNSLRYWRIVLPRLSAAIMVSMFLFAVGFYLSRQLDARLSGFVQDLLTRFKSRYGLHISVGSMETGFGRIVLSDISLGETNWLVIDRAEVTISAIPWRDFLRPSTISINRAMVKLPWSRDLWPQDLSDFLRRLTDEKKMNVVSDRSTSFKFIPSFLALKVASIQFFDGQNPKLTLESLAAFGRWHERKISMRLRRGALQGGVGAEFVEAEVNIKDPSRWEIVLKHRQGFQGYPDWTVACFSEPKTYQTSCDINALTIPEFVIKHGQRYFGPAFAPGYRGGVSLQVRHVDGDRQWDLGIDGTLTNVSGEHAAIGVGVVGPANFRVQLEAQVSVPRRSFSTKRARVILLTKDDIAQDGIALVFDADLAWPVNTKKPQGSISFDISDLSCKNAIAALPANFIPELSQFKLVGTAELHGLARLGDDDANVKIENSRFDCTVTGAPEIYTAAYLNAPFIIERELSESKVLIPVDPARPNFAPYQSIPPLVRSAFVAAEDTGFFHHKGVDVGAIVGAAERNAEEGRAAVGGSTITMQTVKNLFLARDKTISRKAQEMFLAWHLERQISKERILEIYLNMVEFGPGLYGIGHASRRFFGKDPSQLSLKEAIYLASLLPAPVPRYRYYCKGELTPNYERIVRQLLDRMLLLGRISKDEHSQAVSERLSFVDSNGDTKCSSGNWSQDP